MDLANWHKLDEENVLTNLESNINGLTDEEVSKRRAIHGFNELAEKKGKTIWKMMLEQFTDVLVIILIIAAVISGLLGEISDSIVIAIVVVLNAVLGVVQENKAEKSLAALKKLSAPIALVRRNGSVMEVPARELVPGDIILIEAGKFIPADCRLLEVSNLKVEESSLTGESVPVDKTTKVILNDNVALGDKKNMIYMSSMATYGRATAIVANTGMKTEIGKIASMIQEEDNTLTPLQMKLEELGKWLGIIALGICGLMFVVGVLRGHAFLEMFMTSVSLAVAAVPEGLPAIVTIVLAIGVQKMIKRNAIIRKLPAVETLGCATVICSDKTGTLTQNKMTVMKLFTNGGIIDSSNINMNENTDMLLKAITLCNDSQINNEGNGIKTIGDPTETALVEISYKNGIDKRIIEKEYKRVEEIPFDSDRKLMTTINKFNGTLRAMVKGAPDILLSRCEYILVDGKAREITEDDRNSISEANEGMAKDALRVLAAAYRDFDVLPGEINSGTIENSLVFIGLTGMIDPPREEVKGAVKICKTAGIRPVMITGDHKITAMAIAKELGILDEKHDAISGHELDKISDEDLTRDVEKYCVYARVSPEHKVRIVKAWQANGQVVAMTGDGVNDAPALKKADIGAAMGIAGTDVAKEAADMVLTDDNFATVVAAVEEGRTIFSNIKKSIHYLLSCNIGEIITLFVAILIGWAEPLIPIHILWVNLVTDTFPALALGLDPAEKDIMNRKPRSPKASLFADGLSFKIGLGGLIIGGLSLVAYNIGLQYNLEVARTMTFLVLALSQITHSYNVRSELSSIFKVGFFSNKYLVGGTFISLVLQLMVVYVPFLRDVFKVTILSSEQWMVVLGLSVMPLVIVEILKVVMGIVYKEGQAKGASTGY